MMFRYFLYPVFCLVMILKHSSFVYFLISFRTKLTSSDDLNKRGLKVFGTPQPVGF